MGDRQITHQICTKTIKYDMFDHKLMINKEKFQIG